MYILDDPALPLVLQSGAVGGEGGRVIRITYPDSTTRSELEQQLASKRPAEIYDIYFDYNEATITPQSDVVLRDIGDIMRRHPDWRLDIVGHTDNARWVRSRQLGLVRSAGLSSQRCAHEPLRCRRGQAHDARRRRRSGRRDEHDPRGARAQSAGRAAAAVMLPETRPVPRTAPA